jgi:hypothetical protein
MIGHYPTWSEWLHLLRYGEWHFCINPHAWFICGVVYYDGWHASITSCKLSIGVSE